VSDTVELERHLARMNAGDRAARDQLFAHVANRLERLTRKMLRNYPGVQRWCQTGDVFQGAVARLLRSLDQVKPDSLRGFFGLATQQIRRELIDLARHHFGPEGAGAHHASTAGRDEDQPPAHERADLTYNPAALAGWCEFHEQVRKLPDEEREVVDLLFYQELPQADAARLLGINVRTVQRRWQAALLKLHEVLGGQWPGI